MPSRKFFPGPNGPKQKPQQSKLAFKRGTASRAGEKDSEDVRDIKEEDDRKVDGVKANSNNDLQMEDNDDESAAGVDETTEAKIEQQSAPVKVEGETTEEAIEVHMHDGT